MSDPHDTPSSANAALAAQIHAARTRGAYSIKTLAALAQVDSAVITALESGGAITDLSAQDRVMDVLGLRPDSHPTPGRPANPIRGGAH